MGQHVKMWSEDSAFVAVSRTQAKVDKLFYGNRFDR